MSIRHAFRFKFNDYSRTMRVSFPAEKDFTKRVAEDMALRGYSLRDIPTIVVAIVLESLPIKTLPEQHQICKTVEHTARHIVGMPPGLDVRKTVVYFAEHAGWTYRTNWSLFNQLCDLLKRFNYAHHNLIKRNYCSGEYPLNK